VAGKAPGRERPEEGALFWHRGLATTDLAVAHLLSAGPPPASAPSSATADLEVPRGRLCAVRGGMADFEVVATAAGPARPARQRIGDFT
jgi:hypothetical protein